MIEIREQRKRLGLTQEDFAKRLGVSTRTIQNWEQDGSIPATSMRSIERLFESVESVNGWEAVVSRLDRIIELLEGLQGKEVGDGSR
jgi:transcriptional regulator with XRE-family HTH domain